MLSANLSNSERKWLFGFCLCRRNVLAAACLLVCQNQALWCVCPLMIILSFSCSFPVFTLFYTSQPVPLFLHSPFPVVLSEQGIPHSVMPPLPKRPALEKANGAAGMFSTGMLQYQQALANMQFQQQAFIPSGRTSCHPWPPLDLTFDLTKPRGMHKDMG